MLRGGWCLFSKTLHKIGFKNPLPPATFLHRDFKAGTLKRLYQFLSSEFRRIPAHSGEQPTQPPSPSTARRCVVFPATSPVGLSVHRQKSFSGSLHSVFPVSLTISRLVSICRTVRSRLGALSSLHAAVSSLRDILRQVETSPATPTATGHRGLGGSGY